MTPAIAYAVVAASLCGTDIAIPAFAEPWCASVQAEDAKAWNPERNLAGSVRGTMVFAAGLLLTDSDANREQAAAAIRTVLLQQYDAPGRDWHGTFRRSLDEPDPPERGAMQWRHYDPNWREFIGEMLILSLEARPDAFDAALREDVYGALRLACEGASERDVSWRYTNIALMSAHLLAWGGRAFDRPDWFEQGLRMAEETATGSMAAFPEFNSPTYYGVNLLALRMWQRVPPDPRFLVRGSRLETELWRHIAQFYHPRLQNVCGPYDRSYGMDMTQYCAMAGIGIALAVEDWVASPPYTGSVAHGHDRAFLPMLAALGVGCPPSVRERLLSARPVSRVLRQEVPSRGGERVAHALLGPAHMVGVMENSGSIKLSDQNHPITAHWRTPSGALGWLRLLVTVQVDITVQGDGAETVHIRKRTSKPGPIEFELYTPDSHRIGVDMWYLGGLAVEVDGLREAPALAGNGKRVRLSIPDSAFATADKPVTLRFIGESLRE